MSLQSSILKVERQNSPTNKYTNNPTLQRRSNREIQPEYNKSKTRTSQELHKNFTRTPRKSQELHKNQASKNFTLLAYRTFCFKITKYYRKSKKARKYLERKE